MNPPHPTLEATPSEPVAPFEIEAARVLTDLRNALSGVIDGLPGRVSKPADVQRTVKVAPAIGWSVFKAATAADTLEVGLYVPKSEAMRRFLLSAVKAGVSPTTASRARSALAAFEAMVERHSGDREVFDAMLADYTEGDRRGVAEARARKAAFRANVLLWGRQAACTLGASIMRPAAGGRGVDQAIIAGSINLCQTRRDVVLRMSRFHRVLSTSGGTGMPGFVPIDDREIDGQPPGLLHEFCSGELPEFHSTDEAGRVNIELRSKGLGRTSAFTLLTGHLLPGQADGEALDLAFNVGINTPAELALIDVLVHKDLWGRKPPKVTIHDNQSDRARDGVDRLPQIERARLLGEGVEASRTPDWPRHAEMLQWVMEKLGWRDFDSFYAFRARIEHPIMGSRVRLAFEPHE